MLQDLMHFVSFIHYFGHIENKMNAEKKTYRKETTSRPNIDVC